MTNILVCDDDKEIVDAIEIYLNQEGYQVHKAYDGEQAVKMLIDVAESVHADDHAGSLETDRRRTGTRDL